MGKEGRRSRSFLSYWLSASFQGRTGYCKLREGRPIIFNKNTAIFVPWKHFRFGVGKVKSCPWFLRLSVIEPQIRWSAKKPPWIWPKILGEKTLHQNLHQISGIVSKNSEQPTSTCSKLRPFFLCSLFLVAKISFPQRRFFTGRLPHEAYCAQAPWIPAGRIRLKLW